MVVGVVYCLSVNFPWFIVTGDLQFGITIRDMGYVLLHGHICEFRNNNL